MSARYVVDVIKEGTTISHIPSTEANFRTGFPDSQTQLQQVANNAYIKNELAPLILDSPGFRLQFFAKNRLLFWGKFLSFWLCF